MAGWLKGDGNPLIDEAQKLVVMIALAIHGASKVARRDARG
jgi:hypothetical protein